MVSSAYLTLLIFLLAILIPACVSSSPAFLMMYLAYKLNKCSRSGAAAERSYLASEVRGGSWEKTPHVRGQGRQPRGAIPRPRSGTAGRSHLAPETRGGDPEEPPRAQGQGRQLGGTTHTRGQGQRPGGATRGAVAAQAQEGLEELSHIEGQEWRRKEIPLIQGKEQRLCFAGAAVKRYPMTKVREIQVRW